MKAKLVADASRSVRGIGRWVNCWLGTKKGVILAEESKQWIGDCRCLAERAVIEMIRPAIANDLKLTLSEGQAHTKSDEMCAGNFSNDMVANLEP